MKNASKLFAAFLSVTATIVVALAGCPTALAQITITSATFPVAGDTLKMAIDNSPAAGVITITPPGGNQNWNFNGLQVDATRNIVYRPASQGSVQVPGAELFAVTSPNWEEYYNVTSNRFKLQADYGIHFDVIGNSLFNYNPPMAERRAPVNFFDINQISSGVLEPFPPGAFPPTLIAALPVSPDSLRYRSGSSGLGINRLDVVDAWGSLSIPGGTYNVLREKRTLLRETRLQGKVPPLGWIDITQEARQAGFHGLGDDTLITYNFWNNLVKEPIAVVNMDSDGLVVQSVTYKNNNITSVPEQTPLEFALSQNYPNPFNPSTRIEYALPVDARVTLEVYDVLGRRVAELVSGYVPAGYHYAGFNATNLASGVYFYRLNARGGEGKTFTQMRKLMLMK